MIPYRRYLYFLFLNYGTKNIEKELERYLIPTNCIDIAYDDFINKIQLDFSSCLFMNFSDSQFEKYSKLLDIDYCFIFRVPNINVSIVSDPIIKRHVECCLIHNIDHDYIIEDCESMYHKEITVNDIVSFSSLFFNTNEISNSKSWTEYAETLPNEEKNFKIKCKANGADYTRWALGSKVNINALDITKEMLIDSFFKYKESSKAKNSESVDQAMKWGGLFTKLIDRQMKLEQIAPTDDAMDSLEQLCLFDNQADNPKMVGELNDDTVPKEVEIVLEDNSGKEAEADIRSQTDGNEQQHLSLDSDGSKEEEDK